MDPITVTLTSTLPISTYMGWFESAEPITTTGEEITYTFEYMRMMTTSIPIIVSTMKMALVDTNVYNYYISLRVGMTAILFVVTFVLRRLGIKLPTQPIVFGQGERVSVRRLPKI